MALVVGIESDTRRFKRVIESDWDEANRAEVSF
jgi:hypothetical protein